LRRVVKVMITLALADLGAASAVFTTFKELIAPLQTTDNETCEVGARLREGIQAVETALEQMGDRIRYAGEGVVERNDR
jgi:hypothetical protein